MKINPRKGLKKIRKTHKKHVHFMLFVIIFAIIGVISLFASFALTTAKNAAEPEDGTTTTAALKVDDASASNGSYITFGRCVGGVACTNTPTTPPTNSSGGGFGAPPFSSTSLWNTPISATDQSKWIDYPILHRIPDNNETRKWFINNVALNIFYGKSTDPIWTFNMREFPLGAQHSADLIYNRHWYPQTFTMHAPQNIALGIDGDHIFTIVDETTGDYFEGGSNMIIDSVNHTVSPETGYNPGWAKGNDRTGTGFGTLIADGGNSAGVRAANFSWRGGGITGYDIQQILDGKKTDFGHALALALGDDTLSKKYDYVYPATGPEDGFHEGPIKVGSRIGLPSSVTLPSQIQPEDKMAIALFNTLKKYGAFVGDYAGGRWPELYADRQTIPSGSEMEKTLWQAWVWFPMPGVANDPNGTPRTLNSYNVIDSLRVIENNR